MIESFFLVSFWTLLPIVNPVGALAPFLAMTAKDDLQKRRSIALRASVISFATLAFCAVAGSIFFRFFGITVPALKVAGGILLLLVSIDMLNVRQSRLKGTAEEQAEGAVKDDVAVFPLAIPLLSGPGAIASVFMLVDKANHFYQYVAIHVAIFLTCLIAFVLLREAHRVLVVVGRIGLNVLSRLMGLVLASMAVQFIFDGMLAAFPGLAS